MGPQVVAAATREIWSAAETADALAQNRISLIDVRSRPEWVETGVAKAAWPISMHEPVFEQRLFAARDFSGEKPIALILGSQKGPGWIARGLPVTDLEAALASLPGVLR